jgi:hypothetical protein
MTIIDMRQCIHEGHVLDSLHTEQTMSERPNTTQERTQMMTLSALFCLQIWRAIQSKPPMPGITPKNTGFLRLMCGTICLLTVARAWLGVVMMMKSAANHGRK